MAVRIWTGKDTKSDTGEEFYDVTYTGRVLQLIEHNGYDDSDFYALVWDDETGSTKKVWYATTRGWTYNNGAYVDADDATRAKYEEVLRQRAAENEAATIRVGKTVKAVRGRKVPVGTEGEVFWYGPAKFGGYRVGFKDADGAKHFTDAGNVQTVVLAAAVEDDNQAEYDLIADEYEDLKSRRTMRDGTPLQI